VAARGVNIFLGGRTEGLHRTVADQDGFIAAFDPDGRPTESSQIGEGDADSITSIAAGANGIYFAGWTSGTFLHGDPLGGLDAVIGKLDFDSGVLWSEQFGSAADDEATAVRIVGKGVYVAGSAAGGLPEGTPLGESDGFVRKYLPIGTEIWTHQFGTDDYDAVYGMASDPRGVVVVGTTHGAFPSQTNAGDRDVFLVKIAFS
jgi:hypothetical protein